MANMYMEYLTESEREELIQEKEIDLQILEYENEYMLEASLYAKGYGSKLNNVKNKYRVLTKSAKKNIKKGNFDEAEKEIKEAKKILIDLRSQLENEKPGFYSNLFDQIFLLIPFIMMATIGIISGAGNLIVPIASSSATFALVLTELNSQLALIKKQIKEFKKTRHLKDIQMDDLNIYKNSAINSLDKCIKTCDNLLNNLEKAKKKSK